MRKLRSTNVGRGDADSGGCLSVGRVVRLLASANMAHSVELLLLDIIAPRVPALFTMRNNNGTRTCPAWSFAFVCVYDVWSARAHIRNA